MEEADVVFFSLLFPASGMLITQLLPTHLSICIYNIDGRRVRRDGVGARLTGCAGPLLMSTLFIIEHYGGWDGLQYGSGAGYLGAYPWGIEC